MLGESRTLKLLEALNGSYKPSLNEVRVLAEVARLNKLYLAYLRVVGDVLGSELFREEVRWGWFMENTVEVVNALNGLSYALYKFRRPVDHVSVDLDILIDRRDVSKAAQALVSRGFEIAVPEPYTVTLVRKGFIVDLYTEPSFAWVVYMDGGRLLREYVEEVEVGGFRARTLTREVEVVVGAAHAVYKEHMVLLMDCLVAWSWVNREAWGIAVDQGVEKALEELLRTCRLVKDGVVEAPCKLKPHVVLEAYLEKLVRDPYFRGTLPNILKCLARRRDIGKRIITRITRRSY